MKITIITDNKESWFLPHGKRLHQELALRGHDVVYVHHKKRIRKGDICFILSCINLIQEEYLQRNDHNIVVHASNLPEGKGFSPLQWQIFKGSDHITLTLFEAVAGVDAGPYYLKSDLRFEGIELLEELRERMARQVTKMCLDYVSRIDELAPIPQEGEESFFERRTRRDDELDPDRSICDQFHHLRIADNERHPLYFRHRGATYLIKIYRADAAQLQEIEVAQKGEPDATAALERPGRGKGVGVTTDPPEETAGCDLSVVVPVCNEEESLPELIRRLSATIEGMGLDYELIFVTDVNTDRTLEVLREQHRKDPRVKVIKLTTSLGQHIAAVAGLDVCRGRCAVLMDGDLQDYPEDIPKLYERLCQGSDAVYGVKDRKNESALRNLFSRAFVAVLNQLSDYPIQHNTSMFRILSRRTIDLLRTFREHEQTPMGIMALIGLPTATVTVTSGVRQAGETKYSFLRQINLAIGFLLSFSTKPLRMISLLGVTVSVLSFVYLAVVVLQTLRGVPVMGWPTLVVLILLLGGIQLLALGIIGEYIARIFVESKRRPLYIVEERWGELG